MLLVKSPYLVSGAANLSSKAVLFDADMVSSYACTKRETDIESAPAGST
jgi:hypothetical protein